MREKPLRCLLVDDEPKARFLLSSFLKDIKGVEILGETGNSQTAIDLIVDGNPDLVFLDIDMPGKDGLQIAKEIRDLNLDTLIVFVTAHDTFGIEAIKLSAMDYLLKPICREELRKLIARIRCLPDRLSNPQKLQDLIQYAETKKIRFNTRYGFKIVNVCDIICIQAEGNYCNLILSQDLEFMVSYNLSHVERLINDKRFIRIDRSTLVNLEYFSELNKKTRMCSFEKNGFILTLKASIKGIKELEDRQLF